MRFQLSAAAILALPAILAAPLASAQPAPDAGPKFNIMGPSSCAGWPKTGSISSASKAVPLNWALGYVSGQAVKSNLALLDSVDPEAMDKWLTDYCRDHPEATLPAAVAALQGDLEARVAASAPAPSAEPPMFFTPPAQAKAAAPAAKPRPKATATAKRKPAARRPAARKPAATQTAKAGK